MANRAKLPFCMKNARNLAFWSEVELYREPHRAEKLLNTTVCGEKQIIYEQHERMSGKKRMERLSMCDKVA